MLDTIMLLLQWVGTLTLVPYLLAQMLRCPIHNMEWEISWVDFLTWGFVVSLLFKYNLI